MGDMFGRTPDAPAQYLLHRLNCSVLFSYTDLLRTTAVVRSRVDSS
jgi:hypothetical protein